MVLKHQLDFMAQVDCDIWLLTEVPYTFRTVSAPGSTLLSDTMDRTHKAWAAVWAKDGVEDLAPIHEAAALAGVAGRRVCSCLLPPPALPVSEWPDAVPYGESIMQAAIARVRTGLSDGAGDLIWGGSWNVALQGDGAETADADGLALSEAAGALGLAVPTAGLQHTDEQDGRSVDHIAVPSGWSVGAAARLVARGEDGERLSPHDAYVVEVDA